MRNKLEKFAETVITEVKIWPTQFYVLNLNHRVTDINRLWIMARVWKRKFHFDGGKDEASAEAEGGKG